MAVRPWRRVKLDDASWLLRHGCRHAGNPRGWLLGSSFARMEKDGAAWLLRHGCVHAKTPPSLHHVAAAIASYGEATANSPWRISTSEIPTSKRQLVFEIIDGSTSDPA